MRVTPEYAASIRCKLPSGAINRTGTTYDRLTYLWPTTERHGYVIKWAARCSCGNYALVGRNTRSCGCLNEKVGKRGHLSPDAVFNIRTSDKTGVQLAADYNISQSTISNIRCGRRYAGVQQEQVK